MLMLLTTNSVAFRIQYCKYNVMNSVVYKTPGILSRQKLSNLAGFTPTSAI